MFQDGIRVSDWTLETTPLFHEELSQSICAIVIITRPATDDVPEMGRL